MEICKGIHQLKVPIPDNPLEYLNAYLIEGREGFLMIDTGWYTPEAFSALEKGVKDLGIAFTDIADIVVTHVHPDHYRKDKTGVSTNSALDASMGSKLDRAALHRVL